MSDSIRESYLTDLFRKYDAENAIIRVTFISGECYDLRIVSTLHAEASGDIVASVVECIQCANPERWRKSGMNFKLEDIARMEVDGECEFDIQREEQ